MQLTKTFFKFDDAWKKNSRIIDSCGGTRSGKTFSILQYFMLKYMYSKTKRLLSVVSETFPHLKRGAIRDFQIIMDTDSLWVDDCWSKTDHIYTFPNGCQIEFFSADNAGKVHGSARDDLFVNEAQNVDYEIYRQLAVRTKRRIVVDYNPTHEFWVHKYLQPRQDCVTIKSTYKDNQFLSPVQIAEIEANKGDARWWKIYGEGEVGSLEGVIYNFEQIDALPMKSDGMIECYGLDFGFTNDPSVLVHILIHKGKREIYLDEIFYKTGLLNKDIVTLMSLNGVERTAPIFADCAEPKSIAEIHSLGFNIHPCYKGTKITEQIAFINQFKIYVTKRSVNGIHELREYCYDKDKNGVLQNVPIQGNDHFCDAFRYGVFTPLVNFVGKSFVSFA